MKSGILFIPWLVLLVATGTFPACKTGSGNPESSKNTRGEQLNLSDQLERSLFEFILEVWYPRNLDTVHGGYISDFNYDWSLSEGSQLKALVQQARHVWTCSYVLEHYPDSTQYLEYARHGFRFLKEALWDHEYGGFIAYSKPDGSPVDERLDEKRIYGQAFAIYGLAQYYLVSQDKKALDLAQKGFLWMEDHAHDKEHGGYFELLFRDGRPKSPEDSLEVVLGDSPAIGLKDYNSSIHILEALTTLYRVWPDNLVRARLEEMFLLIRDTFVHPDGFLQLYFYPDWTLVPEEEMERRSPDNHWFTQHLTYGHDVETAFLLLETAHVLGLDEDEKTRMLTKKLVDHSLESGWDKENGGFFDAGKETEAGITIIDRGKSWWGLVEGMNALLLMHTLYPEDPLDYYGLFLKSWNHIDTYLIDKEYGGWYNAALDTSPDSAPGAKSHIWKTTYHNTRGMLNCILMLRDSNPEDRLNSLIP